MTHIRYCSIVRLLWASAFAFLLGGCSKSADEVVVYTSVDQVFAEPILNDFARETGIKVRPVFDTEETKSTGVVNRLIARKRKPAGRCVLGSGDPMRADLLKQRGLTTADVSPVATDINSTFKIRPVTGRAFLRGQGYCFTTLKIAAADVPRSVLDLTNPRYRGQVAVANPLFGTTSFHLAALFAQLGDGQLNDS